MNTTSNIIILGHPRSGSYWLQECLTQYNMNELFNIRNVSSVEIGEDGLICSDYSTNIFDTDTEIAIKEQRNKLFESITDPKSVKFHWFQLDSWNRDWILSQKDSLIMFIERKDKVAAFKSLLIANHLKQFKGKLEKQHIIVDLNSVHECYSAIWQVDSFIDKIKQQFLCKHFFYEDMLLFPESIWFNPNKCKIVKQNSIEHVTIDNWEEIINILKMENCDVSNKRIF